MATIPDYIENTIIPERVKHWSDLQPDKEVFVFYSDAGRRALTCREIYSLSGKFTALLQRRGLKHGDVVCNSLPNSPERLIADFGIMGAGCIVVSVQALLPDGSDMLHVINASRCRLLVTDNTMPGDVWDKLKGHLGEIVDLSVKSDNVPNLEMVQYVSVAKDDGFLTNLLKENDPSPVQISPTDVAAYWNTSGSTGFSKLIAHKHRSLAMISSEIARLYRVKDTDKLYSDRPFGWGGGWPFLFVHLGITQVLTDTRGPVDDQCKLTWKAVNEEKCTIGYFMVAFMKKLLTCPEVMEQMGKTLLDMVVATGQPFRKHCYDFIGKICSSMVSSYALVETGCVTSCFCKKEEDFVDNVVGNVSEYLQLKIVNENFREVTSGENGQILIKGAHILEGYVNNPKATAEAFTEDGWFMTGDVGMHDDKGYLYIEGRQSDAFKSGQQMIHPSWVERKMRSCPYVDEVMVVGIPDKAADHHICACVIPKSGIQVTSDLLKDSCDPVFANSASGKPEFYILVKSFPARPTGKPDRRALADLAAKQISAMNIANMVRL